MVWNYHDDDVSTAASPVNVVLSGLVPSKVLVQEYRIDNEHSNSFEAWKSIGSPQNPSPEQYAVLEKAGALKLYQSPFWATTKNGKLDLSLTLPRQGVSLFQITW